VRRKKRKKNRQKHKRGGVHGRRVISPEEKRSFGLYFWGRGRKERDVSEGVSSGKL
jgi:hypothetical protein